MIAGCDLPPADGLLLYATAVGNGKTSELHAIVGRFAYVKPGDLVTIVLATGVYVLLALTFVLLWMDAALDREAVWERLYRGDFSGGSGAIGYPAVWSAKIDPGLAAGN